MAREREVIFEFLRVGNAVKVIAVDVATGIEASIVGNVITGYLNGAEMISVVDDNIKSGAPGIGFNFGVGTTNADHGVRSFEVHTYD